MKHFARVLNYVFHPLLVPTIGLLIILNSGTYLALLNPAIKKVLLMIMALGTLIFPALMLVISRLRDMDRRTHPLLPMFTVLVLYLITMIYFLRLPVNQVLHTYSISIVVVLVLLMVAGMRLNLSLSGAAFGALVALLLSLMLLFSTSLQGLLILVLLAGGTAGSLDIYLERSRPAEVLQAWVIGFAGVFLTFLIH